MIAFIVIVLGLLNIVYPEKNRTLAKDYPLGY